MYFGVRVTQDEFSLEGVTHAVVICVEYLTREGRFDSVLVIVITPGKLCGVADLFDLDALWRQVTLPLCEIEDGVALGAMLGL